MLGNAELKKQIEALEAKEQEAASTIKNLESENANLKEGSETAQGAIKAAQEAQANAETERDGLKAKLKESEEALASEKEGLEDKIKAGVENRLAGAAPDIDTTKASDNEEAENDFEASYKAANEAGGVIKSKFLEDNKAEIQEYLASQSE